MTSQLLGSIIDALLTSAGGVAIMLYGYGIIGPKRPRDMLDEENFRNKQRIARICGAVLIAVGFIMALVRLASAPIR